VEIFYSIFLPDMVPVLLVCLAFPLAAAVWRHRSDYVLRTVIAGGLSWLLLMVWFLRSEPTLKGGAAVGIALGVVLGFLALAIIGLRRTVVHPRTQFVLAIIVALVASFATPIIFIFVGCSFFGECP